MTDPRPTADTSSLDTAPQPAVQLPLSPAEAGRAAGQYAGALLVRAVVAGVATVMLVVVSVLLFRHGIRDNQFPPYLNGATKTIITRYSAPWIAAAAGAALLAGLSFASFAVDLFRRIRLRRTRRAA